MVRIKGLWGVLAEVDDVGMREDLALVAVAIQVQFAGRVVRERSVVEFMADHPNRAAKIGRAHV